MKKVLIIAVFVLASFVGVKGAAAVTTPNGIVYNLRVQTEGAVAFAQGTGVPLSRCTFAKHHRVFACFLTRNKAFVLTRPKACRYNAYAVKNGVVIAKKHVNVCSGGSLA